MDTNCRKMKMVMTEKKHSPVQLYLPCLTAARYRPETQTVPPKKVMVVANDISYQSGSFAIEEDDVFNAAGQRAKEKGLPLVYLASNSGARIGMAQEVKDVYRVMFADPEHPEKGCVVHMEQWKQPVGLQIANMLMFMAFLFWGKSAISYTN